MLCAIADDLKWSLAQSQHLKTRQPSLSPSACLQLVITNFQNHFRNFRCRVQNKSSQFANCDLFLENCEWNFAKKFQTLFLMIKLFFPSNCFNCLARTFHTHTHPQLAQCIGHDRKTFYSTTLFIYMRIDSLFTLFVNNIIFYFMIQYCIYVQFSFLVLHQILL